MNPTQPDTTVRARCLCASSLLIGLALALGLSGCGKGGSSGRNPAEPGNPGPATAQTVTNKLAAIAAAGDPVTLADLNQWYPEPPAGQNAAEIYTQAFDALTKAATSEEARTPAYLALNQKALGLLLQAAGRKACRYPLDLAAGFAVKVPHLSKIKTCAGLLQAEAINQAGHGHTDAATKALLAGLSLVRSLENEPLTISRLVEITSLSTTLQGLEQALTRQPFAEAEIMNLQAALKDAERVASFRRALVGERCWVLALFQVPPDDLPSALTQAGTNGQPALDLAAYRKTPTFQQDFDFALDYYSNLLAGAELPWPPALAADTPGQDLQIQTASARKYLLSSRVLPASRHLSTRAADAAARVRLAVAALAVERYRLKHAGALPGSLSEVTPEFLSTVPTDPFDGQPLRYQKLPGRGYTVSSVGEDRKDDHAPNAGATSGSEPNSPPPGIHFTVAR